MVSVRSPATATRQGAQEADANAANERGKQPPEERQGRGCEGEEADRYRVRVVDVQKNGEEDGNEAHQGEQVAP